MARDLAKLVASWFETFPEMPGCAYVERFEGFEHVLPFLDFILFEDVIPLHFCMYGHHFYRFQNVFLRGDNMYGGYIIPRWKMRIAFGGAESYLRMGRFVWSPALCDLCWAKREPLREVGVTERDLFEETVYPDRQVRVCPLCVERFKLSCTRTEVAGSRYYRKVKCNKPRNLVTLHRLYARRNYGEALNLE